MHKNFAGNLYEIKDIWLFSGTVLNVRKHIFERIKHRKSSRNIVVQL